MTLVLALTFAIAMQAAAAPQAPAGEAEARFAAAVDGAARLLDTDVTAAVDALDHLATDSVEMRRVRPLSDTERATHRQLGSYAGVTRPSRRRRERRDR